MLKITIYYVRWPIALTSKKKKKKKVLDHGPLTQIF